MKICRFIHENAIKQGIIKKDLIYPLSNFEDLYRVENKINEEIFLTEEEIVFLPPTVPSKIVCVGRNYAEHAAELGNKIPKEPLLFLKAPSSLITHDENIQLPGQSNQVEHEGELAVVIGRGCKNLAENDNSLDYVWGYACLNDVTARDLQVSDIQFTRAKSFDTFCPISNFIETDLDCSKLQLTVKINGLLKQLGNTSQMVFSVPFLITYISNQMTLNPGDIIATGTPAGVSKLNSGDICEIEIEGIGILRNPVQG